MNKCAATRGKKILMLIMLVRMEFGLHSMYLLHDN